MLFMDMPPAPPQYTPVAVAETSQAAQQGNEFTIGICKPIENNPRSKSSAVNSIGPVMIAMSYLDDVEHRKFDSANFLTIYNNASMTLLAAPMHGELKLGQNSGAYYSSNYTFEGLDSATVLVEVGGYKVRMVFRFVVMPNVPGSGEEGEATDDKRICPNGWRWKISTTPDANGNITISSVK